MKSLSRIGQLALVAASAFLMSQTAQAALTLEVNPAVSYQQTTNNPCVIGDPSCKEPANMFYTKDSGQPAGQTASYTLFSPVYQALNQQGVVGMTIPINFIMGIDENFANTPEYLVYFKTWICAAAGPNAVGTADQKSLTTAPDGTAGTDGRCTGATLDAANSYTGPTTELLTHNGNGYSDALLSTFQLLSGRYYFFEVQISSDTDGMEEFFIIPSGAVPTPEPGSLALLGTALLGTGMMLRKKFSGRS